jgi:hypothetical protein
MNRAAHIQDKIIMIRFAPVKTAPMTHLERKGEVLAHRPGDLDIDAINNSLLNIPNKSNARCLCGKGEIDVGINAREGRKLSSISQKGIGVVSSIVGNHILFPLIELFSTKNAKR